MSTYYLIDYENVHDSGLKGVDSLNYNDCVFIFYTVNAKRVGLDVLEGIQAGLRVIRVPEGNQSLDQHLISYLGFLIGQDGDPEARFQVISKDNGYRRIIEFWNRWFGMEDKVCQRASISGQEDVSEPVPYFTSDGKALTERNMYLRHVIIQHMRNKGEKSQNGHWYMMVSKLCIYLNTLDAYREEREASGKKAMSFLQEDLNDILMICHERNSDFAYLISDDEYWDFPADNTAVETELSTYESTPIETESSNSGKHTEPIEAIVRAPFENDGENDEAGRRRVKASLLRDRLEKLDGYRLARSESGKKPLEYLAEALDNLVLIRVIKSRSWAYLLEDEVLETEPSNDELAIPEAELSDNISEKVLTSSVSVPSIVTMNPFEQTVYRKMLSSGKDSVVAAAIAMAAADALLSEQPKASFHSRLWQQFGQKQGTRYYRDASSLIDDYIALPAEVPVDNMGLSVRSTNSLKRAGFYTADEFISKSDDELLKIRNLGQKGVDEIRNWIQVQLEHTSLAT